MNIMEHNKGNLNKTQKEVYQEGLQLFKDRKINESELENKQKQLDLNQRYIDIQQDENWRDLERRKKFQDQQVLKECYEKAM